MGTIANALVPSLCPQSWMGTNRNPTALLIRSRPLTPIRSMGGFAAKTRATDEPVATAGPHPRAPLGPPTKDTASTTTWNLDPVAAFRCPRRLHQHGEERRKGRLFVIGQQPHRSARRREKETRRMSKAITVGCCRSIRGVKIVPDDGPAEHSLGSRVATDGRLIRNWAPYLRRPIPTPSSAPPGDLQSPPRAPPYPRAES